MKWISRQSGFCAFCRHPRTIIAHPHLSAFHVLWIAVTSVLLMFIFFQSVDLRVIAMFGFLIGVGEIAMMTAWRLALSCKYCGFDPALYRRDPHLASERVKKHLQERRESLDYLFSRHNPFAHLPTQKNSPQAMHVPQHPTKPPLNSAVQSTAP